jgi:hypothetical protein
MCGIPKKINGAPPDIRIWKFVEGEDLKPDDKDFNNKTLVITPLTDSVDETESYYYSIAKPEAMYRMLFGGENAGPGPIKLCAGIVN